MRERVRLTEHSGHERAGQPHPLRHRRDRHALRNCRLAHQTTDLPGPPRPRTSTGNSNGHRTDARPTQPRDVKPRTASATRQFLLRSRLRLPTAAGTGPPAQHIRC
jgi:hypothetical protein